MYKSIKLINNNILILLVIGNELRNLYYYLYTYVIYNNLRIILVI